MNKKWSIRAKLTLLATVLIGMQLILGLLGGYISEKSNQRMESLYEDRVIPLQQLKRISDAYAVNIVDTAHKARNGNLQSSEALGAIAKARQVIQDNWKAYTSTYLVPEEQQLIRQLEPMLNTANTSTGQLETLLRNGDADGLVDYTAHRMYPAFDPLQDVIGQLIGLQLRVSKEIYTEGVANGLRMQWLMVTFVVAAGLAGLLLSAWIIRDLMHELGAEPAQVRLAAETVAQGDLTYQFHLRPGDQRSVMVAMKNMTDKLRSIVHNVRSNAESVASATVQIAQGNLDLSVRTESQASALEQTAASMEELGTTVRQNADHARQADQTAREASEVATGGGNVVTQVVTTMRDINASSQKIADIIGVIDGIAFQTNILALNAAVEAARAGEQGRGFAVVANEVRTLAQRSANAAREIKGLISDSVQRIAQGSALADRAGSTMDNVVNAIHRVTEIVGGISSASVEQNSGISQIHAAVSQIDQHTQQNSALVEESTAAAQSLKLQAQELVNIVAQFKLGPTANVPRIAAAAPLRLQMQC